MSARRPVTLLAVLVAMSLLVFAACSGSGKKKLIPTPPRTVAKLTTAPPTSDLSAVSLAPVDGRAATTKVEITGGNAVMTGLVVGPDGPVAGATVRLERFIGDAVARLDVVSEVDGSWRAPQPLARTIPTVPTTGVTVPGQVTTIPPPTITLPPTSTTRPVGPQGVLGGRYRIRAWRTPDLALTTPQIIFVEEKQSRPLSIQLSRYTGIAASAIISPDPPVLNGAAGLTAVVTTVSVDADGIVKAVPLPGATVSLIVGSGWLLTTPAPTTTNGQGRAGFQLRCQALGQSPIDLSVNGTQSFALQVRGCVPPATTTTLPFDPNAPTSIPGGGPTTTGRGGPPIT